MSRRQKLGDWPVEVEVLDEDEARRLGHDPAPPPDPADRAIHRRQVDDERRKPHPAERAFEEDD